MREVRCGYTHTALHMLDWSRPQSTVVKIPQAIAQTTDRKGNTEPPGGQAGGRAWHEASVVDCLPARGGRIAAQVPGTLPQITDSRSHRILREHRTAWPSRRAGGRGKQRALSVACRGDLAAQDRTARVRCSPEASTD